MEDNIGESEFAGWIRPYAIRKKKIDCRVLRQKEGDLAPTVFWDGLVQGLIEALETSEGSLFFERSKLMNIITDVFQSGQSRSMFLSITLLQHMGVLFREAAG